MSISPTDFMEVAMEFKSSPHESYRRAAISRAYYACYHQIKAYMTDNDIKIPESIALNTGSHDSIIKTLTLASSSAESKSIAYRLQEYKKKRVTADYFIKETISLDESIMTVSLCNKLFESINR